jgi:uncharacterized membrane protein
MELALQAIVPIFLLAIGIAIGVLASKKAGDES